MLAAAQSMAAVPRGWRWPTRYPFRELTVAASSDQEDKWPAAKAIDGDTSEPDGIWQTLRNSPKSWQRVSNLQISIIGWWERQGFGRQSPVEFRRSQV